MSSNARAKPTLVIDLERNQFQLDGRTVELQPRVLNLLMCLASRAGQLVGKEQLLDEVWGHRFITEGVIKTAMSELRSALGDDVKQPRWIETIPRRGYRYIGPDPLTRAPMSPSPSLAPAVYRTPQPRVVAAEPGLVGRDGARVALQAAWQEACEERPAVLLVAGDAGMGKTALLSRFMHGLDEDAVVAVGQCAEALGQGEPYLAILEALSSLLAQQPTLQSDLRRVAPTWLSQMPWHVPLEEREALAREVAGASQERMLREFAMLLDQVTLHQPWLLVLEDLHWSDSATVQLLGHLARRRGKGRWLLVGSFRPVDVAASEHPLGDIRRELRLHGKVSEIALAGLDEPQLARLIEQRLPGAQPPGYFLRALYRHTDGLPLFVERVLAELMEQGLIHEQQDGSWAFPNSDHELPLPPTLLDLMERQIDRLPAPTRQMLEVAALSPNEFDDIVMAKVLAISPSEVRQRLDGLVRRRLWLLAREPHLLSEERIATSYGFQHALMRHAFEQRIAPASRVALHRSLGQAVQDVYGGCCTERAVELAEHARHGHEPLKAARWYSLAALQALQRIAPVPALDLVRLGLAQLDLAGDSSAVDNVRVSLLQTRMRALVTTRGYSIPCIEDAFQLVASWPMNRQTLPVWHAALWARHNGGDWAGRDEVLNRLLAQHARVTRENAEDWALAAICAHAQGVIAVHADQPERALPLLEESLRIYSEQRPPGESLPLLQDFEVDALCHLYLALVELDAREQATSAALRLEARLQAGVDPLSEAMALFYLSFGAQLQENPKRLTQLVTRAQVLLSTQEALPGAGPHGVMQGWRLCESGEVHAGLRRMQEALRVYADQGSMPGRMYFQQLLARQALNAGESELAEESLQACEQLHAQGETLCRGEVLRTRAAWLARRPTGSGAALRCLEDAAIYARERGLVRLMAAVNADRQRLG